MRIVRRSPAPPISSGIRLWTGAGWFGASPSWKYWPENVVLGSSSRERRTCTASSNRSSRSRTVPTVIPYAACSFTCQPAPAVLVPLPPRADPEREPPVAALVARGRDVGQDRGMPVGHASDQRGEPQSRHRRRQRRHDRPALEYVAVERLRTRAVRHEVVGEVHAVPAGPLAVRRDLVD